MHIEFIYYRGLSCFNVDKYEVEKKDFESVMMFADKDNILFKSLEENSSVLNRTIMQLKNYYE